MANPGWRGFRLVGNSYWSLRRRGRPGPGGKLGLLKLTIDPDFDPSCTWVNKLPLPVAPLKEEPGVITSHRVSQVDCLMSPAWDKGANAIHRPGRGLSLARLRSMGLWSAPFSLILTLSHVALLRSLKASSGCSKAICFHSCLPQQKYSSLRDFWDWKPV